MTHWNQSEPGVGCGYPGCYEIVELGPCRIKAHDNEFCLNHRTVVWVVGWRVPETACVLCAREIKGEAGPMAVVLDERIDCE